MSKSDVVISLLTIVYGLILTDLFLSVHRLIRHRQMVRWHWLPLVAAWYLFLTILKNWWGLTQGSSGGDGMNIFFFLAYGHLLVLIYLAVSAVLPDEVPESGLDLRAYYFQVHRYFWGLFSGVVAVSVAIGSFKMIQLEGRANLTNLVVNGVFLLMTVVLAVSPRPRLHQVLLCVLTGFVLLEIVGRGLAG